MVVVVVVVVTVSTVASVTVTVGSADLELIYVLASGGSVSIFSIR